MPFSQLEPWLIKLFAVLPKVFFATAGALLSLMLSGDIKKDGTVVINRMLVFKFFMTLVVSLTGGSAVIDYYSLEQHNSLTLGFIYLLFAIFGMLIIGVIYQSLAMYKGKTLGEIITDVKDAFFAIFGR